MHTFSSCIFIYIYQVFTLQDVKWWTGATWTTCGLLWCFISCFDSHSDGTHSLPSTYSCKLMRVSCQWWKIFFFFCCKKKHWLMGSEPLGPTKWSYKNNVSPSAIGQTKQIVPPQTQTICWFRSQNAQSGRSMFSTHHETAVFTLFREIKLWIFRMCILS